MLVNNPGIYYSYVQAQHSLSWLSASSLEEDSKLDMEQYYQLK